MAGTAVVYSRGLIDSAVSMYLEAAASLPCSQHVQILRCRWLQVLQYALQAQGAQRLHELACRNPAGLVLQLLISRQMIYLAN